MLSITIDVLNNKLYNHIQEREVEKIKSEIIDAYSKDKLTGLHYNVLKEKISELETKNKSNDGNKK